MNQAEFTAIYCARPQNFAWFLGAGASRSAGLPTATDILWDIKRKYYCREENQELSRQDIQNPAVRDRIQSFMDSRGFPPHGAPEEYAAYFERIFRDDKERQRRYLKAILSEEGVTLSVGNRVLGAMLASGLSRAAFTTNFDSVVERAVAEVGSVSLSAYHLEGSHAAVQALNNEEYPFYCKLHGDFRYDSLKNLPADLAAQNAALAASLVIAGNRFGFVVAGYSGRDASVMDLFCSVLASPNPFPHGVFWLGMKGGAVLPAVSELVEQAQTRGVTASYVEIETFDALMLRLWRNIESKPPEIDARVRKARLIAVNIPLPPAGTQNPVLRLNALPVVEMPAQCLSLAFRRPMEFNEVRRIRDGAKARLILAKSQGILCWGSESIVRTTFGDALLSVEPATVPSDLSRPDTLQLKGFVEEAVCWALARGKPLLSRSTRSAAFLIANPSAPGQEALAPLANAARSIGGQIAGVFTTPTDEHPKAEPVRWAEALRLSLDQKDGRTWLLMEPDIWIWPQRARRDSTTFLDKRQGGRYNAKHDALLNAWIHIILGTDERNADVATQTFDGDAGAGNPCFRIGTRTAFSRRRAS